MSTLSPPPLPSSVSARPARRAHALDEPRIERRVGIAGTVLAHVVLVGLFWLLPDDFMDADTSPEAGAADRAFEIELSPDLLRVVEAEPAPDRFVEVNPAAPENPPDATPLFGAQNQQVAQPVPTPDGESLTPALEGEGKENATALVSGSNAEASQPSASEILAQAFTPPTPPSLLPDEAAREAERAREEAARAVNPLPGGENLLGESDGGVGTTVATVPPVAGAETGPEAVQGTRDGTARTGGYFAGTPAIDRTRPQDRPRLATTAVQARNARTIRNEFGSKNIGAVAYSAKWSAYGEYLQQLIDAVQVQWERLILRSAFYPTSGATVRVVFKIDGTGMISEIVKVDGTGGELAQRLCVSAITERAPYGEWTEDMIALLGKEQELTFTFHYQ